MTATGTTFAKDQGKDFGRWADPTSRLMYRDVMPVMLNGVDLSGPTIDLGGANGLLREFIPDPILTVDIDPTKEPDVVGDARTWTPGAAWEHPRLVVLRYVLHYLNDADALDLFAHLHEWHRGTLLVIQFANSRTQLPAKWASSRGEQVWFRTPEEFPALFGPWVCRDRKQVDYTVRREFYLNRLNNPDGVEHGESVIGWVLEP